MEVNVTINSMKLVHVPFTLPKFRESFFVLLKSHISSKTIFIAFLYASPNAKFLVQLFFRRDKDALFSVTAAFLIFTLQKSA
jgi:hypothetical protein